MGCPFFGEINEPNSRAFWDDFDENESVNTVSFSWEYINKNAIENQEIEELLLIEGESISNVVDGILMKPSDFELFAVLNPSQALKMYKNANKLICVYNRRDILDSGSILNEVMQFLNIPKVITISIHSKAQYKTENLREIEESFTILKGLNSEVDYAKELKCPNFIVGLSGGGNTIRYFINYNL
ncbi:hypothetical protein ACFFRR_005646 [Megaselia abdita]